jgi:hypothetical protein
MKKNPLRDEGGLSQVKAIKFFFGDVHTFGDEFGVSFEQLRATVGVAQQKNNACAHRFEEAMNQMLNVGHFKSQPMGSAIEEGGSQHHLDLGGFGVLVDVSG